MLQGICSKIDQKDIRNRLKRAGKERYDAVQITQAKKNLKIEWHGRRGQKVLKMDAKDDFLLSFLINHGTHSFIKIGCSLSCISLRQ